AQPRRDDPRPQDVLHRLTEAEVARERERRHELGQPQPGRVVARHTGSVGGASRGAPKPPRDLSGECPTTWRTPMRTVTGRWQVRIEPRHRGGSHGECPDKCRDERAMVGWWAVLGGTHHPRL